MPLVWRTSLGSICSFVGNIDTFGEQKKPHGIGFLYITRRNASILFQSGLFGEGKLLKGQSIDISDTI